MSTNKCKNCGANVYYDPKTTSLKCDSCGSLYAIDIKPSKEKQDYNEKLNDVDIKRPLTKTLKCNNCGASIVVARDVSSSKCEYCGSGELYDTHQTMLPPDNILPFKITKDEARTKFYEGIKKYPLLPRGFKKLTFTLDVVGSYVSAFVFDAKATTNYSGVLLEDYEQQDNGPSKPIYKNVNGSIENSFDNMVIESSPNLTQDEINSVKPFNFNELVVYDDDFVKGYILESYNNSLKASNVFLENIVKRTITKKILDKHDCKSVQRLDMNTNYISKKYTYAVLPIYFINFDYKGKKYKALINGQTGKIGGDMPKSWFKIMMGAFAFIAFVAVIIYFMMRG